MESSPIREVLGPTWLYDSLSVAGPALALLDGQGPATPAALLAAVAAEQIALFDGTFVARRNLRRATARLKKIVAPGDPAEGLPGSLEPLALALEEGSAVGDEAMCACKGVRMRALQFIARTTGEAETPFKAELLRLATLAWSLEAQGHLKMGSPEVACETLRNAVAEAQDVAYQLFGRLGEFLGTAVGVYLWEELVTASPLEGGGPLSTPERQALLDLALQFRYPVSADGARVAWVSQQLQRDPEHPTLRGHRLRICRGPRSEEVKVGGPLDAATLDSIRRGAFQSALLLAECNAGLRALSRELWALEGPAL